MAAIVLVLVPTAIAGLSIMRTRPVYARSVTVLFATPFTRNAAVYTVRANSLIATGSAISQVVMSTRTRGEVVASGGTASYNLAMINLFNQDYPDYGYPEATLTVTSPDPSAIPWTYLVVKDTLIAALAQRQRQAGAMAGDFIRARFIDDSGLVVQKGSRKRALAGLLVIALVAYGTTAGVLTRLTRRLTRVTSRRHRAIRSPA